MKIAIGCDHGGLNLKKAISDHLIGQGHEIIDVGTNSTDSCNYPDYAKAVTEKVLSEQARFGILLCGTGIGMSIAANKVSGIRAAAVSDCFTAQATRAHNDTNVLCMGERTVGAGLALTICDTFLKTEFEGGRHLTRVQMIAQIEKENKI